MHGGPIYDKLSNASRRYCPDFEQPTHWSSLVRKAKTRLNKGKYLEEPIFSKGKVSDIAPCCQKLNIHVNPVYELPALVTAVHSGKPHYHTNIIQCRSYRFSQFISNSHGVWPFF